MAAQSDGCTVLRGLSGAGDDIKTCVSILEQLGVKINSNGDNLVVSGGGIDVLSHHPKGVLDCANSATIFRMLSVLVAQMPHGVVLDGDNSLRGRNLSVLITALRSVGVSVRHLGKDGHAPIEIQGPFSKNSLSLSLNDTSQVLSAFILAAGTSIEGLTMGLSGTSVSNPYSELSIRIARNCGAKIQRSKSSIHIDHWVPKPPTNVTIPRDSSLAIMAVLASRLYGITVELIGYPESEDVLSDFILADISESLGISWKESESGEVLLEPILDARFVEVDLSSCSDLLAPLATLMCLGAGGRIRGISHARNKESDRISSTNAVLEQFGMLVFVEGDELILQPSSPSATTEFINTYSDHRLHMVSALLATRFGGIYESTPWHQISHPDFSTLISSLPTIQLM